ncbi:MAG: hypothetical protein LBS68_02665 [Puniceicoccales bacterium]|jgi:hypothetical protein|nr:hypothetical protein [Puniceicoccales bacterium]
MDSASFSLVPDWGMLREMREGFENDRAELVTICSTCTDSGLEKFYTEKISALKSAERACLVLMAIAGRFDWPCAKKLETALLLCILAPDLATKESAFGDAAAAFREVEARVWVKSVETRVEEGGDK